MTRILKLIKQFQNKFQFISCCTFNKNRRQIYFSTSMKNKYNKIEIWISTITARGEDTKNWIFEKYPTLFLPRKVHEASSILKSLTKTFRGKLYTQCNNFQQFSATTKVHNFFHKCPKCIHIIDHLWASNRNLGQRELLLPRVEGRRTNSEQKFRAEPRGKSLRSFTTLTILNRQNYRVQQWCEE